MKTEVPITQLLRWRLTRAEADAPPAPRAARLLELARPWWEVWPQQFQSLVERLSRMQISYGHAMAERSPSREGHPVPVLIDCPAGEMETFARVLYLDVRGGRLRLRFQLNADATQAAECFDATIIADPSARPLLSAAAILSVENEYRVETELPAEFVQGWEHLKVTDRMPFRLILRPGKNGR